MPRRRFPTRSVLWSAVLLAAAFFAVQGGEYGTTDLFSQRARRATLAVAVDSLRQEVDSLRRYRDAIARDPAVQERIAREEFGMIRAGELLYRFAEPGDSLPVPTDTVDGGEDRDGADPDGAAVPPSP